jgi:adenine-specific DNA-methyltransferase
VRLTEGRFTAGSVELDRSVERTADDTPAPAPWTSLLPSRAARIETLTRGRTARLGDYARIRRGIASGDNSFFCLTQAQADEWEIEPEFLVPVALGARDLPCQGGALTRKHWEDRKAAGGRAWLLWCHEPKAALRGTNVLRYIERGEQRGVAARFNCRTREPWYGVERVPPADYFVTYMARQRARFVRNEVAARCMTSLLNLWVKDGVDPKALGEVLEDDTNAALIRAFGRTYGGGLGKIEPNDLRRLPVPPLDAMEARKAA